MVDAAGGVCVGCVWGRMPIGIKGAAKVAGSVVLELVVVVVSVSVSIGSACSCIVSCSVGVSSGCCVYL